MQNLTNSNDIDRIRKWVGNRHTFSIISENKDAITGKSLVKSKLDERIFTFIYLKQKDILLYLYPSHVSNSIFIFYTMPFKKKSWSLIENANDNLYQEIMNNRYIKAFLALYRGL